MATILEDLASRLKALRLKEPSYTENLALMQADHGMQDFINKVYLHERFTVSQVLASFLSVDLSGLRPSIRSSALYHLEFWLTRLRPRIDPSLFDITEGCEMGQRIHQYFDRLDLRTKGLVGFDTPLAGLDEPPSAMSTGPGQRNMQSISDTQRGAQEGGKRAVLLEGSVPA